jgi:hypothetical protein
MQALDVTRTGTVQLRVERPELALRRGLFRDLASVIYNGRRGVRVGNRAVAALRIGGTTAISAVSRVR